jgi:hypothetical protein
MKLGSSRLPQLRHGDGYQAVPGSEHVPRAAMGYGTRRRNVRPSEPLAQSNGALGHVSAEASR